jgi:hypothetical protein
LFNPRNWCCLNFIGFAVKDDELFGVLEYWSVGVLEKAEAVNAN